MRTIFLTVLLLTIAQLGYAQSTDERYETIGTLSATVNESELLAITQYDHEKERSEIKTGEFRGIESTIVITVVRAGTFRAGHFPRISFEIWRSENDANAYEADVTYVGEEGVFQASQNTQNRLPVSEYIKAGDLLSFSIAGELVPVTGQGSYEIDSTRESLAFSGTYNANLDRP